MSQKRLPRLNCKLGNKTKDGYEFGAYRDQIGNVCFLFWKMGTGFREDDRIRLHISEVKKLRDWLNKVIEYTERK